MKKRRKQFFYPKKNAITKRSVMVCGFLWIFFVSAMVMHSTKAEASTTGGGSSSSIINEPKQDNATLVQKRRKEGEVYPCVPIIFVAPFDVFAAYNPDGTRRYTVTLWGSKGTCHWKTEEPPKSKEKKKKKKKSKKKTEKSGEPNENEESKEDNASAPPVVRETPMVLNLKQDVILNVLITVYETNQMGEKITLPIQYTFRTPTEVIEIGEKSSVISIPKVSGTSQKKVEITTIETKVYGADFGQLVINVGFVDTPAQQEGYQRYQQEQKERREKRKIWQEEYIRDFLENKRKREEWKP